MQAAAQKLDAVIGALKSVREHVRALDGEDVDVAAYNRWIGMLNSARPAMSPQISSMIAKIHTEPTMDSDEVSAA